MNDDFSTIMNRLTENARGALQKADYFSKKYNKGYMGTDHLLAGLLAQEGSVAQEILNDIGILLSDIESQFGRPTMVSPNSELAMMSLSESLVLTLRMSSEIAKSYSDKYIGTEHILKALVAQESSTAMRAVEYAAGNVIDDLKLEIEEYFAETAEDPERKKSNQSDNRWLNKFGENLSVAAEKGEITPAIGRDEEVERIVTVLARRTKSNPVLIGEAGVGKTAIVEGLAVRIHNGNVPPELIDKKIYQIDLSSVVAGTKFRGDFEERLKGIIDEAVEDPNIILFIDELHLLVGSGSSEGTMDAANILKPALARGKIQLIGATTMDEFRKIEKDKALARRFQTVYVAEPKPDVTLKILRGIKSAYEKHHSVNISDEILESIVNMSTRYIGERYMPDKAIDVLDEAAAIAHINHEKLVYSKTHKLQAQRLKLLEKQNKAEDAKDYAAAADAKTILTKIDKELEKINQTIKLTPDLSEDDIAHAISLKTGIPVSRVHGSESELLMDLESKLKKSIIGQDEAIATVAKAIRRGRSGVADPRRPIGSFIFMGATGVGKTELARVLAREVFGGEEALVKIDMSEYSEKHNVARLFGAPAGYVGYEDGGKLTEAIRRRPYSVVLFDEIEKAHPEVFNTLLQILEDGTLTDGRGNKVRFNNTIVILTSNLGAEELNKKSDFGFNVKLSKDKKLLESEYAESKNIAMRALNRHMRPELINRLDNILVFHSLTRDNVKKILDNLISDLKKRLATKKVGMTITEKAKDHLIKLGFSPEYGARSLRRTLEDQIETIISEQILSGKLEAGQITEIDFSRGKFTAKISNESTAKSADVLLVNNATKTPAVKPINQTTKSSQTNKSKNQTTKGKKS